MGKKVSAILFRVNKFNNYQNTWVFNYRFKGNFVLNYYYTIKKLFDNILLNIKTFYYNSIYQLSGKIIVSKINFRLANKFITTYNNKIIFSNLNLFMKSYKVTVSCLSPQRLKLFLKFNLLKYTSVQNLYNKLYTLLLTENVYYNSEFLGLKIIISGRLSNTKLATSETFQLGLLPLQQLDIFIFYEKFYICTKYGLLGIKIWIGKKLV